MVINSLHISNFQSHKDSLIEFDPQVTALIGLGNHGKSAILKAFRKIIRNTPNGNSFIRNLPDKAKTTTLTLQTEDKSTDTTYTIERKVGRNISTSNDNMYKMKSSVGEEYEFTKFARTGIPEEINKGLGISLPQVFGDIEFDLNFHIQKDDDFLIRGKGLSSIRSKVLGRVTGVDIAQKAIQIGRLKEKNFNQEIEKERKQRQNLNLELEKYKDLDIFVSLVNDQFENINKLSLLEDNIEYYKVSLDRLKEIINNAVLLKKKIESISISFDVNNIKEKNVVLNQLRKLQSINTALERFYKIVSILQKEIDIESIKELLKIKTLVYNTLQCKNNIDRLSKVTEITLPSLDGVKKTKRELEEYNNYQIKINQLNSFINTKVSEVGRIEIDYKNAEIELENYKQEIKVCPVCQRPF